MLEYFNNERVCIVLVHDMTTKCLHWRSMKCSFNAIIGTWVIYTDLWHWYIAKFSDSHIKNKNQDFLGYLLSPPPGIVYPLRQLLLMMIPMETPFIPCPVDKPDCTSRSLECNHWPMLNPSSRPNLGATEIGSDIGIWPNLGANKRKEIVWAVRSPLV